MVSNAMPWPTLPLSWYVDPAVLDAERQTIFATAPGYVGSVPLVPEHGCFHTIGQHDRGEMLLRSGDEVKLVSNVCLHRSMQMLDGRGKTKTIICPMHRWSYDLRGKLLAAPLYPETPCLHLPARPLQDWQGLLFAGPRDVAADLAPLGGDRPELDVRDYRFVYLDEEEQPFNWKIPIEVLLENYHAPFIHPGFNRFVAPAGWYENDGAYDSESLMFQELPPHPDFARNPASQTFERWQRAILQLTNGSLPDFAAIIALYAPNVIIEWWPFMFDVTTYVPRTPERTLMVREFYFDRRALEELPEYAKLARTAWYETQEADELAHRAFQRGRAAACRRDPRGLSGYERYQSPMEESVLLFHSVLMREVAPLLS